MTILIKLGFIKVWRSYKIIALEIAALLFMASVLMTYLITQDYLIGRVCRVNLGYSEDVCKSVIENNGNYTTEESTIQKIMTEIRRTRSIIDYSIPIVFVLFQGSYSDIHGRKLALLLPCIGFALQAISLIISHYFENWGGYTIVLVSTIPKCLSGSDVTFRMAALSYISDISTESSRTLRTGFISAALTLGVPIGFALGGASMKAKVQTEIALLISAVICITAFFQILLFVDNRPKHRRQGHSKNAEQEEITTKKKFLTIANFKSVMRSLMLSFDGVTTSARIQIFVLIFVIICINAPIQGEFGVMYLYLRKKLMWDSGDYGIFSTYVSLVGVLGTVISMGLLCSYFKLSDPVVGFIAGISQFGGSFMYAFAYNSFMIYLAPAIDMMNGTMGVVAKSMLTKICPPSDFGKLFSFLAVIELLVPLVFDPTYSTIYGHTLDTFPGAVFLLSALITIPPQITYLFYIWRNHNAESCDITTNHQKDNETKISSESHFQENHTVTNKEIEYHSKPGPVTLNSISSTSTIDSVMF